MYSSRARAMVHSRNSTIGVPDYGLDEKIPVVARHSSSVGIGRSNNYGGYDAMRDAETKFYQNPGKYTVHKRSTFSSTNDDYSMTRSRNERVSVVLEHWSGCTGQGVADDIKMSLNDYFPDVKVTEFRGRVDSFEVFINGKLLYSRIMQGGYPYEEEVLDAVWRAKHGKEIFQVDRMGHSSTCNIL